MPIAVVGSLGILAPFGAMAGKLPPDALANAIRNAQPAVTLKPLRYRGSKYETPDGKRFGAEEKRR